MKSVIPHNGAFHITYTDTNHALFFQRDPLIFNTRKLAFDASIEFL